MAFQQQIQSLKTQHEEFVNSLKQSQSATVPQLAPVAEPEKPLPMTTQAGESAHAPHERYFYGLDDTTTMYQGSPWLISLCFAVNCSANVQYKPFHVHPDLIFFKCCLV